MVKLNIFSSFICFGAAEFTNSGLYNRKSAFKKNTNFKKKLHVFSQISKYMKKNL